MNKTIITFVVICLFTFIFSIDDVFARNDSNDIIITTNDLINMSPDARNKLLEEMKKVDPALRKDALKLIGDMDVAGFKGKAEAIADTMVLFCDKLGMKVNEFVTTPVGFMATFGIIYKLGVFGSVWSFIKGSLCIIFFSVVLFNLNTKTIKLIKKYDGQGEVFEINEVLIPKLTAISGNINDEYTAYSVVGSIICVIVIILAFINM